MGSPPRAVMNKVCVVSRQRINGLVWTTPAYTTYTLSFFLAGSAIISEEPCRKLCEELLISLGLGTEWRGWAGSNPCGHGYKYK